MNLHETLKRSGESNSTRVFGEKEVSLVSERLTPNTRIRRIRFDNYMKRINMPIYKFASDVLGISPLTLHKQIRKGQKVSPYLACRLLGATQIPWDELFYEEEV